MTPLANLSGMAERLGLGGLFVKDKSYRFGLNAFKALGGSFAMARYIAEETGKDVSEMSFDYLTSEQLEHDFGQATFFTATDGNHGRGVAWAAKRLHQKAVVYMPKGTTKTRYDSIAKEGAQVTIEDLNYDDCVRLAAKEASEAEHGVIVQDTAWEGYEKILSWIMQGYG
ncbi:MAG: pyridoxal-phosphate dependent enzyme [Atopobiaceae bacterium]|nr:pyridoxal-phosphate dependent enzyme [Atopobiaceae bacterium]